MTRIEAILDGVIEREGGYVDNSADKGGPTKYGITAKVLGAWRGNGRPASAEAVRELTAYEAMQIYRDQYVVQPGFLALDETPILQSFVIDFGVLSGPKQAIKFLQRALSVTVDGILGPETVKAALAMPELRVAIRTATAQIRFVAQIVAGDLSDKDKDGIPDNLEFLRGWMNRTCSLLEGLL